ncbi:two-component sensor histidine kinase [Thermosporothrix hazakensis]|uniref:histidine kinase n=1 Tax=Thermosporothrix hazakensis TaxID=644383 RepID=A0A326UBP7_THEHA|nr:GAF domain-containing protein [Thermosporothrix hazakensis]PZW25431.1 two-component sensor histidine kinase [Thermosporothrix hazakensis]GCE48816.1 hypothetical protein KTH_36850 [Thermosporothrix hazakensis]
MTQSANLKQLLTPHAARLQSSLQRIQGVELTPGSDADILLQALTAPDEQSVPIAHFEQEGNTLARGGGKLDTQLSELQAYFQALQTELQAIFAAEPSQFISMIGDLNHLQAELALAVTRGYQQGIEEQRNQNSHVNQRLEHRLDALQRINGVSNSATDLDQTLEFIAQVVAEELQADLCSIFLYDELQRVLTLRATNGPRPLGSMHFLLRLGEGYSGWVADKGRTLLHNDALTDPNYASEARAYGGEPYRGIMALPIIFFGSAERLIGVISVQSKQPRDFTPEEVNFVEVTAGTIALNIENGRLYEQTDEQLRRKVHELATIHRVSSIIASTLNLDEVLQIITTQAVHLSGAERSCIFELDPDRQRLHVLAHYGLNAKQVGKLQIKVGQCCAGRTVQTGRPNMAVDCFHADEHCFIHDDPMLSSEIHSVLCVPLKVKQKILGCICIYSSHRHLLSPEQMQLVITFANEAAIAIENARLYEETRRGLELKSVLLRELHHRVKNNLATVAGILSLQRRRTKSPEVRHILAESVNRVQGLAATHDLLAHEDVSEGRVDDIARKIVGVANANLSPPDKRISFQVEPCPIVIPSRAVTILALVINEMVSNAIKHGMADQQRGIVIIRGSEEDGNAIIQVIDSGKGPSTEHIEESAEGSSEGLGLSLIKHLIIDLGGRFSLRRGPLPIQPPAGQEPDQEYTIAEVRFPLRRGR